jgi:hypothetical protein
MDAMNEKTPVTVDYQDGKLKVSILEPCQFAIKDTKANRKILYILFRLLTNIAGETLLTFAMISRIFGLNSRQASNHFYREFQDAGYDFGDYLKRKKRLEEAFSLIERQVLAEPLLSIRYHYDMFMEKTSSI